MRQTCENSLILITRATYELSLCSVQLSVLLKNPSQRKESSDFLNVYLQLNKQIYGIQTFIYKLNKKLFSAMETWQYELDLEFKELYKKAFEISEKTKEIKKKVERMEKKEEPDTITS